MGALTGFITRATRVLILVIAIVFSYACEKDEADPNNPNNPNNPNDPSAGDFLLGTEAGIYIQSFTNLPKATTDIIGYVNNTLKTHVVKVRLSLMNASSDGVKFSPDICFPSKTNCREPFNLDETVKIFQKNGWSMAPMLSHDMSKTTISPADIDSYVNFVDWFVSRYKTTANIKYVELVNAPTMDWKGTDSQLLEATNKTYDRIKSKFPDIMMGTPGFEYWADVGVPEKWVKQIEYFLDKNNGAKFDFWAFHGYPLRPFTNLKVTYPPTRSPDRSYNPYAGVAGIAEIRSKLDANGWQNRLVIDMEYVVNTPAASISDTEDSLYAAHMIQDITLKRTLTVSGRRALYGILPLKIRKKNAIMENAFSSLNSDGTNNTILTKHVKATGLLWSKLAQYGSYAGHVSGAFDDENQIWIERFKSAEGELYIYFKPFKTNSTVTLDDENPLTYELTLPATPASATITDINGNLSEAPRSVTQTLQGVNSARFLEVRY